MKVSYRSRIHSSQITSEQVGEKSIEARKDVGEKGVDVGKEDGKSDFGRQERDKKKRKSNG